MGPKAEPMVQADMLANNVWTLIHNSLPPQFPLLTPNPYHGPMLSNTQSSAFAAPLRAEFHHFSTSALACV